MAENNSYVGVVTSERDSYQKLTTKDIYEAKIAFACWTKTPFTRVVGAEGFGVESLKNLEQFKNAKPTGRMIRFDTGGRQISGPIFATTSSSFHSGRLSSFTPRLTEGGDEWVYAWHQLNAVEYAPVMDVEDNAMKYVDVLDHKMMVMMNQIVQDFNYAILGNSSAPDYGSMGPNSVYSDLANLISVTQDRTVGGISATNPYWQNGREEITSVGGGGQTDRPLILRRKLLKRMNTQMTLGESTGPQDYLILTTQGGHQYYDRLMYADANSMGNGGAFGISTRYDAAGVQAHAFMGAPMIWDPAVTTPHGATASTEAFYGIHIPTFCIAIRTEGNFKFSGWEKPREHDTRKTMVASVKVRYTPMVTSRRTHWVAYNIPACPD